MVSAVAVDIVVVVVVFVVVLVGYCCGLRCKWLCCDCFWGIECVCV